MKIDKLLKKSKQKLQKYSPTPNLDAEILLSSVLGKNREFLFSHPDKEISQEKIREFKALVERRIRQEPVAYIIEEKSFYGRSFLVNPETLIPRPETELLIEKTSEHCRKEFYPSKNITLIDIGTGSGCILISLLKELQKSRFKDSNIKAIGIDISPEALKIAKKNSKKLKIKEKIDFLEGDLLSPILKKYSAKSASRKKYLKNTQLIITANLPYLSQKIYEKCPASVLDFEPQKALIANKKGLGFYIKLLNQIKSENLRNLTQNIYLIFEISPEQEKFAQEKFEKIFSDIKIKFSKDLAQKWRFIEIKL